MNLRLASIVLLGLTGCAMTSQAIQIGPDTYTISAAAAPIRGGAAAAKPLALQEAANFCASKGKQVLVQTMSSQTINAYGAGSGDVVFRCLSHGDAELRRPTYRQSPDVVIENRR